MRARAIPVAFVAAALALLTAIGLNERSSPDQDQHARFTQLMVDRHALDQDIARHALESRFAFESNYDELARQDRTLRLVAAQMRPSLPEFLRPAERAALEQVISKYDLLMLERGQLLEHFKSENALLRNSIGYFPNAVAAALAQNREPELLDDINELRAATLSLALKDDARPKTAQREAASRLHTHTRGGRPAPAQRSLELLLAHAGAIALHKVETDALLRQLLALPLDESRKALGLGYARAFAAAQQRSHVFGHFISALSVLLLGIVAYAGLRLQRAATSLGRVNERLETAVKERTADLETEMARRARVELELRQAQKLEAVGQLASGIAHEINTPIQYVGDSIYFLREAFGDIMRLIDGYQATNPRDLAGLSATEDVDLDFLRAEVPGAFERTADGTRQVASIVQAMKTFAHTSVEKGPIDLNSAIENTLIVARNEYKYVAEVELALGALPEVTCNAGGIRQVLLNLIVNAAHAIADKNADSGARGTIRIGTELRAEQVVITIEDSGGGIPQHIHERIFDPFFTTKEPGRGSGQGLAISQSIVTQHGGKLWFTTTLGAGTSFFVQLPLAGADVGDSEEAERAA